MITSSRQLLGSARQRAGVSILSAGLYRFLGFRELTYRRQAVACLNLRRGDTAVDIGCGTGANFGLLRNRIGPDGRVIGVDFDEAMLAGARMRCERRGWDNIALERNDVASYRFPEGVDAVLATFVLTLVPDFDGVVARAADALRPGGRLAVLDLDLPARRPNPLVRLFLRLTRPCARPADAAEGHPSQAIGRWLSPVSHQEFYFGLASLAAGEKAISHLSTPEREMNDPSLIKSGPGR